MKKRYTVNKQGGPLLRLATISILMTMACTMQPGDGTVDPQRRQEQDHRNGAHHQHLPGNNTLTVDDSVTGTMGPVNERVIAAIPTIRAEKGTRIFSEVVTGSVTYDTRKQASLASRVSGRIEKLNISYNYQPVKKGQLILEIYSPDLVAAQRELLLLSQGTAQENADPQMLQRARKKLALYGMRESQVNQVLRSGQIAYRVPVYSNRNGYVLENSTNPAPGSQLLLRVGEYVSTGQSLFTLYSGEDMVAEFAFTPAIAASLQKGQKLLFHKTDAPGTTYTGTIGLIQPVFREGTNFTRARVYLQEKGFRAGELLTAVLPISYKGWWLPQQAVADLGRNTVVFKKENGGFVPKTVKATIRIEKRVLIEEDLRDWEIASNAAYLVDSESFIKTGD